jgi:hypothetical protein
MVGEESVAHKLFPAHCSHPLGHSLSEQYIAPTHAQRSPSTPSGIILYFTHFSLKHFWVVFYSQFLPISAQGLPATIMADKPAVGVAGAFE